MTGNSEIIQKKGRACTALNVLSHKFLALVEETCGQGNEWWGKSGGLEFSNGSFFLLGVMNWDRGHRGLPHHCEGHQYPVICKQSQQVAGHHCGHTTVGSEMWGTRSPCPANFPNAVILLSLLFVLINLRHFRRAILIRNKCKDICGDHKRPDLRRLNEVTYVTVNEIIVYCIKSCFGKCNRGSKLEWNEHGLRGEKNIHCQFYGALKYLCSKLAFFGDLLSVARTRKLF